VLHKNLLSGCVGNVVFVLCFLSISLSGLDDEASDEELIQQSPSRHGMTHRHGNSLDAATERALSGGSRSPDGEGDNSFDSTDSGTSGQSGAQNATFTFRF
jgi:hypothetical protein